MTTIDIKIESPDPQPACENQPPPQQAIVSDGSSDNKPTDATVNGSDVKSNVRKHDGSGSENGQPEKKQLRSSPRRMCRRMQSTPVSSPTRRSMMAKNALNTIANLRSSKELKKLQVYGAGPKMPGFASPNDPTAAAVIPPSNRDPSSPCLTRNSGMPFHLSSTNSSTSSTTSSRTDADALVAENEETKVIKCTCFQ